MAASLAALSPARAKKTGPASQRAETSGRVFTKPDPGRRVLSGCRQGGRRNDRFL
jgi:hypothetical protein